MWVWPWIFRPGIRDICNRHGILLVFDEILSGFRTGITCAQGYYGVTPDLCTLGKALTNGSPLAAVAGRESIMQKIMDSEYPVIAGGTFSGNIPGCAAGQPRPARIGRSRQNIIGETQ